MTTCVKSTIAKTTIKVANSSDSIKVTTINNGFMGPQGPIGPVGPTGEFEKTFESLSKNVNSWGYDITWTNGLPTTVVYQKDGKTITKTITYNVDELPFVITLDGDTSFEEPITKTITYNTEGEATNVSYS